MLTEFDGEEGVAIVERPATESLEERPYMEAAFMLHRSRRLATETQR
jgi:hypothetical protein